MANEDIQKLYQKRLDRVNKAIRLEPTDRVPLAPFFQSYMQRSGGSSYKDIYYDFDKAAQATIDFYKKYPMPDVAMTPLYCSGRANELAATKVIDWPGRPGTKVSDFSSHQVIELEPMLPEEYPEMLNDFTGFMIRKYIPRVYPNLKALEKISITPTVVLSTTMLAPFYDPEVQSAMQLLAQIGEEDAKAAAASADIANKLAAMGYPTMMSGISEAPYDILGDYFRGTMGIFEDLTDPDMAEYIDQACAMFAEQQIRALQYFRYVDMPVKRVFFPLHKAMDGFMNEKQFERFYWKPLKKIMMALIDMGVTPFIYTEGPYDSRIDMLTDVPKGKVLYHFEKCDMKRAKEKLSGIACISGNLSVSLMEFGTKEQVEDQVKYLLETCAPGGGYIFDFNGSLENCKPENLDAMFNTFEKYCKY